MGSVDGDYCVESKKSAVAGGGSSATATAAASRGARRSLAKDLKDQEPYSPRLFTKKQLLLLQQQRQYQFLEDHHRQQHSQQQQQAPVNLLNSRRVYPSSSSSRQLLLRNAADFDSSSHGSPLVLPRKVPKKMVVDEKQLAMKLLRARNLVSCSSTSSSSSSSENASLRASAEGGDILPRSSLDIPRRSLLSGYGGARSQQIHSLVRQKSVSSSSSSLENAGAEEKIKALSSGTMVMSCSGRSSDAEESTSGSSVVRMIMGRNGNGGYARRAHHHIPPTAPPAPPPVAPMLLRSASCSSAMSSSSSLSKLVRLKAADMGVTMQEHAFYCANQVLDAMDKLHCKRVAWTLKKEFDKAYGPAWHCIVGTSFGSYVTHSVGGFLYFSIGKVSVLLFQTAVELIEHH
ncbi:uncharacterized protein LOC9639492 [Selaginella moellendorffii]|uniref:uncharacterized protein LOC9639492 n=1 Tax=Selaginella moellendorffii TaxID=88036 RepID=UPI000D1C7A76|nr:uncharacterized protein LOC9639492 [Selaginella moellendorffii]|eukprot:XP_002991377.2 uncharacterized protein LOC9639492 [Selaginella moellendorffii]